MVRRDWHYRLAQAVVNNIPPGRIILIISAHACGVPARGRSWRPVHRTTGFDLTDGSRNRALGRLPGATSASPLGPGAIPASSGTGRACDSPVRGRLLLFFLDLRAPDFFDNRPAPRVQQFRFPPIRRSCKGFIILLASSVSAPTMWTSGRSRSRTATRPNAESPGERTLPALVSVKERPR